MLNYQVCLLDTYTEVLCYSVTVVVVVVLFLFLLIFAYFSTTADCSMLPVASKLRDIVKQLSIFMYGCFSIGK